MHMADALLSPAVGVSMCAVSIAANAIAVAKMNKDDTREKMIPIMGVMGAFVFAAQMINFTIPLTGSSGHIGGGTLLAAMIGGYPALIAISAVLIIQCLFFADGGLLALGCNIFNIGVIPCLIVYPLVFKPIIKAGMTAGRIAIASIAAVVIALQLGAFCVVVQTELSGVTALPFSTFFLFMQPIHLAIGIFEGVITAAIISFVYKARPEIFTHATISATNGAFNSGMPIKGFVVTMASITIIVGGVLSLAASAYPDGLEWSIEKSSVTLEGVAEISAIHGVAASAQDAIAFMPDYNFKDGADSAIGGSAAGVIGGVLTFVLAAATALIISIIKKKRRCLA